MEDELQALRRELRKLGDHEEIRQLLYRYARGVDRADADTIKSVYATGVTPEHGSYLAGRRGHEDPSYEFLG